MQQAIDSHLLALIDHHEKKSQIRSEMIADLAELAATGNAWIAPEELFQCYESNSIPLTGCSFLIR